MSATHDLSPRASAARSPRLRLARAVGRARGSFERWGRPRSASSRWKERLSSRGSGTWSRLPVSSEVLLTTTCAWGDAPLVVVVVDDGDLVVGEVLRRPLDGEPPQGGEVDAGAGVGGEDVVLPRPRGPSAPSPPVPGGLPHRVHLRCPVAGAVAREVALPALYGRPDIQEVAGEGPAVPLEVAHDPAGPGVPADRFDDSHPSPPTGRGRGDW